MSMRCSRCGTEIVAEGAAGCPACHLHQGGAPPVRATGEFGAVTGASDPVTFAPPPMSPLDSARCSWCGKDGDVVRKLLGNGTVAICDECVALCADVLDVELGVDWRKA